MTLPTFLPTEGVRLLKVREVGRRLNRSKSSVHNLIDTGKLRGFWLGGEKRVTVEDLEHYIASLAMIRPTRL